ncbi:hypothetical protein CL621_03335, partial [archaeon]|nr:hypothetical protein [archaeon]
MTKTYEINLKKEIDLKIKSFSDAQLKYWEKRAKKKNSTVEKLVRKKILSLKEGRLQNIDEKIKPEFSKLSLDENCEL